MTKDNNIEMGAECLGFAGMAVTWWRMKPSENPVKAAWRQQPQVTVMAAEATDENGYAPASSVNISGAEALHALRSAIDEALKYEMPKTDDADSWKQKCDLLEMDRDVVSRQLVASEQGNLKKSYEEFIGKLQDERNDLQTELKEVRYGTAVAHDTIKSLRTKIEAMEKQEPFDADSDAFRSAFEAALEAGNWPATRQGDGYRSPSAQIAWRIAVSAVNRLKLYPALENRNENES